MDSMEVLFLVGALEGGYLLFVEVWKSGGGRWQMKFNDFVLIRCLSGTSSILCIFFDLTVLI